MRSKNQFIVLFLFISIFNQLVAQDKDINHGSSDWQDQGQDSSATLRVDTLVKAPPLKAIDESHWWKILGYEKLNTLVEVALAENHYLEIAESYVDESKARVKLEKSAFYPSVGLNPSFFRQEFSANRPLQFEIPADRVRSNTYALTLDVSYEIDLFGKLKNKVAASEFNLQASSASNRASRLDIIAAVAKHFILLLTLDSEEDILDRTLKAREENLELVSIRYQAGLTNEIDLQRAKSELSSVAVQSKKLQIERRGIELMLATLVGQPAQNFVIEKIGIKYFPPEIALKDSTALPLVRPDLQAAHYAVEANKKQLKSSSKNLYPSLHISGSTGFLAGESDQVLAEESRNWLIGATLSVPIFEGGRRQAQVDISEHQLQRSVSNLKQKELLAYQEVLKENSNLLRLNEQLIAQQEFLAAARRAANLSHQRYRKGLVTYLEVVDSERIVLEAERLSIQLVGQQLLNTVDLIVAKGGEL